MKICPLELIRSRFSSIMKNISLFCYQLNKQKIQGLQSLINSIFSSYKTAENKGSTYGDLITLKNNNSNKTNHIYLWHLEEKCMIPPPKR